jgi:fumarate reductase subunit D
LRIGYFCYYFEFFAFRFTLLLMEDFPQPPLNTPPQDPSEITDLEEDKLYAILSYVGVLVLIPLLTKKNNSFVQFHARQGLVILVGFIIALIAVQWVSLIGNLLFLSLLIVDVIALVQALLGRRWKIPIIGDIAQKFRA